MINIYFGDISHQYQKHITFPYNIGLVASYALNQFKDKISVKLFKTFEDLRDKVIEKKPDIIALSNFMWNSQLSINTLKIIKNEYPDIIAVMGGANYFDDRCNQLAFFENNPHIDFHVYKEGEAAFSNLLKHLIDYNMDVNAIKNDSLKIGSVHYFHNGLVCGDLLPRMVELDSIPSPYLTGLLDPFFEMDMSPIIVRTRGCPFTCTFCNEGSAYFLKVRNFSPNRFIKELEYMAKKLVNIKQGRSRMLHIADANFGMFKEDLQVAKGIAEIRRKYDWPGKIQVPTGKNKKDRVVEVIRTINDGKTPIAQIAASVQSTDPIVLENIKRKNISTDGLIEFAKDKTQANDLLPYGEVILALPGDTVSSHKKSICDLIDQGITKISHQYLTILPGTEMDSAESRKEFGTEVNYRIMPGAYGSYSWNNLKHSWYEIEERAVANNTMTFRDYIECIEYDLTVETYYNDNIFDEYTGLLHYLDLPVSHLINEIYALRTKFDKKLDSIYNNFTNGRKSELFKSEKSLNNSVNKNNQLIKNLGDHENKISLGVCKSNLIFLQMKPLHKIAKEAMLNYIGMNNKLTDGINRYIHEATVNSISRKTNLLNKNKVKSRSNYDFVEISKQNYCVNPEEYFRPDGIKLEYKTNENILEKYRYLKNVEPNAEIIYRKLLFEPRVDSNEEFCRKLIYA